MNLLQLLQDRFRAALRDYGVDPTLYLAMIKPAQDPRYGDYQANFAMPLAKKLGKKPRDVAQEVLQRADLADLVERSEVAGPGFINLHVRAEWLAEQVRQMAGDARLGVPSAETPRTLVIDFSSPNVAKPLHVGHLRSTIIGDSLARLFRFLGHRVITDNHLGDWGTQFGILLYGYKHFRDEEALRQDPVRELTRLYLLVRNLIKPAEDEDEEDEANSEKKYTEEEKAQALEVQALARQETAKLHAGDPENVRLWQLFMPWCLREIDQIYERLDVHFDQTLGESFYNPMLADVVRSLEEHSIARRSQGAVVVGEGEPPAMVQKKDGAFTYTTTDLATIHYRIEHWHPDTILYVVDSRQALHFNNLFATARRWGHDQVALEHVSFGSVLGADRKPLKTREGGAVELGRLLNEAVERAGQVYEQSRAKRLAAGREVPDLDEAERRALTEVVGLGAVKYADLSQNRTSDYVFNWEKMLAMDGNTGTYMQYVYVRNRGILRKAKVDPADLQASPPPVLLEKPTERALCLELLRFSDTLTAAAADYRPNAITAYLWDLSKTFSAFYDDCPVVEAETPVLRQSRLLLCDLTARVIQKGLELLGIKTVERM